MAEDVHNPLNNDASSPDNQIPTPPSSEPEVNTELSDFLDDHFSNSEPLAPDTAPLESEPAQEWAARQESPAPPPPSPPPQEPPPAVEPETALPLASDLPTEAVTAVPGTASPGEAVPSPQENFQREILERWDAHLGQMNQPQPETAPEITPQAFYDHYRADIERYVQQGWIEEDRAALYPMDVALQVHMWKTGGQLQQGIQQTHQITQADQARREQEELVNLFNNTLDSVAARGDIFEPLSNPEVRQGFQDFLVQNVLRQREQINPDFLATQFYAYHHNSILDTIRQQINAQAESAQSGASSATPAQLAQQEGGSARIAPSQVEQPEFVDILEGLDAAKWFQ